jgi:ABC-type uncharacterized transport system permease subunit
MTASTLSYLAIALYVITWVMITMRVRSQINSGQLTRSKIYLAVWVVALIVHILALHYPLFVGKPLSLSFFSLASYVTWFISLVLFITTLTRKIESLAIFVIPFTVLSIILELFLGRDNGPLIDMKSGLGLHIFTSLLAYSLLMLASFQALLLAFQNKQLRSHQVSGFMKSLPSLEDMEHLLFRFINIGVVILSIALLIGFYYLENLFGSHIAHKTILSLISLFIFSALIIGRWKYGWRGRKAINFTLVGFIVLMLAFFGTKFVQEFIL